MNFSPPFQTKQETPQYLVRWLGGKSYQEQPRHTRAFLWLCGLETMLRPADSVMGKAHINRNIYEEKTLSYIMHANMGLAIIFITGYWAYYSL